MKNGFFLTLTSEKKKFFLSKNGFCCHSDIYGDIYDFFFQIVLFFLVFFFKLDFFGNRISVEVFWRFFSSEISKKNVRFFFANMISNCTKKMRKKFQIRVHYSPTTTGCFFLPP